MGVARGPLGLTDVYVGWTGSTLAKRMQAHLNPPPGWRKTAVTTCGGRKYREDLFAGLRFRTKAEAMDAEISLAAHLADEGYTVFADAAIEALINRHWLHRWAPLRAIASPGDRVEAAWRHILRRMSEATGDVLDRFCAVDDPEGLRRDAVELLAAA